ncbi:hypothetical protein [Enterobacter roggenkampii]|uniref:hypothetical protein n=1 Tax=Enterobacter roggenkampii TaxID=1812935 RepID=UPI001F41DD1E|nr:hypothetical protein [Enterobacter roggenkampii]
MKKEEELITSFIWCGATVCVYTQVVKFAGTTIQRHLLPTNLRRAVDQQVAGAANHQEARPAVFNIPNGEKEMPNSSIMALALAMCNVEAGRRVKVPAQQLHLLMMWLIPGIHSRYRAH